MPAHPYIRPSLVGSLVPLASLVVLIAAGIGRPVAVTAQTVTGTIQGTVVDTTDARLPGATVVIENVETGASREYVTNESGYYEATFLPLGRYQVTVSLTGFGSVVRKDVVVTLNFTHVIDVKLDPQLLTEIVVTAERPAINRVSGEVKQSLTEEQILEKPTFQNLNNNNTFLSLAETFAGFQENPTSGQNNPTASSGSSINFNGTGSRGATFQIDGVNNDDASENQNRQGVNLAAIKEFQVITNSFSAEFGRGFGAVVLVQTKAGSNQVHGEGSFTRQDSDWDARQFFATVKPVNHRNNVSGVAGFPLVRNKLFMFASAEYGDRSGQSNYTRDLFTPAELALPRLTRGNDTPANRAFIDSILARFGTLTPNDARSNRTYSGLVGFAQTVQDLSGRLDWEARRDDRITLRYQYSRQKFDNEDIIVGEATQQNNRQANLGLTWTRTLSNRLFGEFRYGLGFRDTNVNVKEGNDTPIVRFAGSPVSGSIIGNAGTFPINRDQVDNQFVFNLNWALGSNHSLKTGTDIRLARLDDLAQNFARGFWSFSANCGGQVYASSYAAFLDGCIASYQKAYGPFFAENRIPEYNFYVEDDWRIRPNLTVNLGLRYELAGAAREAEDRLNYTYGDDTDNIEPRLGIAWSPEWDRGFLRRLTGGPGNASVRAGYGLYHGRIFQSVFTQSGASIRTNPPNAVLLTFNTLPNVLNVSDPSGGFVFTPGPQTARHAETLTDPSLEMPSTHQWNLTLERSLPWQSTMRVTYSGVRGIGLLRLRQANLAVSPEDGGITVVNHPNNAPAAGFPDLRGVLINRVATDFLCAGTGFFPGVNVTTACPNPVPLANNEISLRVPRTNERRPDPQFTTNTVIANDSESWYHGLQLEFIKRVSQGLRFEMNYTWSKAIDFGSEATAVGAGDSNSLGPDPRFFRGLSRFHTPHRLTINGSYLIPVFAGRKDLLGSLFGGWQVTGVLRLAHGTPFTVIDTGGGDLNWDGFSENRPVILDPGLLGTIVGDVATATQDLPAAAFRRATPADYENGDLVGRNTFYGDSTKNVDLALLKSFALPTGRVMIRVEAYNALNRTKFAFPNPDFAATTFGRITAQANTARQIQFSVRYIF